jgi:steroid 5-alpha reductase family enzyme
LNNWQLGVSGTLAALLVGVCIAWAGSSHGALLAGVPVFALCGAFAYAVQWSVFVHAWVSQSEALYDLTGSLTYIVMVVAGAGLASAGDARSWMLVGLIVVWALRLGPFLYMRVRQAGEDRRFRSIKRSFPLFFMTWTLQGTWVFITASCALAAITTTQPVPLGAPFWIGGILWLCGFAVEVIADKQKSAFRTDPANADRFISSGLWAWSRHPNYFGEIVLWFGIALMAYPALVGWQLATLISPVFVIVLLTFISGARMLENRANRAWGEDPEYQAYKQATPLLMLRPPRRR